jgi:hypothetical protein
MTAKNEISTGTSKTLPGVVKAVKPDGVLTGKEAAQADAVAKFGLEIITAVGAVAGKYLELCLYIRKHEVSPKLVSFELQRLGFKRSRVSEVNRVAQSSEATFKMYEAKLIGFDKCLNMSRVEKPGALPTASPAALLMEKNHVLNADEVIEAVKAEGVPSSAKGGKKKGASGQNLLKAAARLLCCKSTRDKVWTFADGAYKVTVEKLPKTGPSIGAE